MIARPWRPALLLAFVFTACGDPQAPTVPVVAEVPQHGGWQHELRFDNGVRVGEIQTPDEVEPGSTFEVSWRAEGPLEGLWVQLSASPPRAASRQVALGGVGAPPVEVPLDPRTVVGERILATATATASVELPAPWHSPQVMLTLELLDGDEPLAAVQGPRRGDGVAQLALIDVAARPTSVSAVAMQTPPTLDGVLDEAAWGEAVAQPMVHSLDGEPYDARPGTVRFGWDADALYVAAQITDPDIWSDFTQRDDPLWNQEVFEVFIFGDAERRGYLELQVSPRGTVFDARFERYRKGDEAWNGTWRSAVDVRGTLDNRRDRDEGWSAELAIPWTEICAHTEVVCPVAAGSSFRINAFRFERPHKQNAVGLALSPPRVPDFHAPQNAAVLTLEAP